MAVFRLEEDWSPFNGGTEFIEEGSGIYALRTNPNVRAKIPADLLTMVSSGDYWRPINGRKFYYIDEYGDVSCDIFDLTVDELDGVKLSLGNCFNTEENAQAVVDWFKARHNLIESGAMFINALDVDSDETKCFEAYLDGEGMLLVSEYYLRKSAVVGRSLCFFNVELARQSIKEHRDDWLTYLGVKEKSDGNS